jgi:hypothetical protein
MNALPRHYSSSVEAAYSYVVMLSPATAFFTRAMGSQRLRDSSHEP